MRARGTQLRRRIAPILALACFPGTLPITAQSLTGAGGSFPNPIYSRWFAEYAREHPGVRINYQPVGSGAGIRQVMAGVVDFGATESPMTDTQLGHSSLQLMHIPTLLGAVVPVYHLPGDPAGLRFAPDVLAAIFTGRITRWDDARLRRDNPGVRLPSMPIVPVYRADGSGTTFVFTDFLCKVSPSFASTVGRGTAVSWPAGIGGKGNEGVAGLVHSTPGALGYVETAYTGHESLLPGTVRNAAGTWVEATPASIAAAASAEFPLIPADFRVSITNAAGTGSYPIASFSWLLVRSRDFATPKGQALAGFLRWMLDHGESEAVAESYAPLPEPLADRLRRSLPQGR